MQQRTVWKTPRAGSLSRLRLKEEVLPPLGPDHLRIETKAIGLNFADVFALVGLYDAAPRRDFIPGLEFSGIITDVGAAVSDFSAGDRVFGVCRFGAYASSIDIHSRYCELLPEHWDYQEGAAFPVQTLTAWYALRNLGGIENSSLVFIQSAAGGVGLQALQICRALGVEPFGAVGTTSKKDFLETLGFEQIVVRDQHFPSNLESLLDSRRFDIALDAIGGQTQKQCYELLAPTGRLIVFGAADFAPGKIRPNYLRVLAKYLFRPKYDPLQLIHDNKSVMGFNLIWLWDRWEMLVRALEEISELNLPPPHVGHQYPFAEAPAAVEMLRSGHSVGKVVLVL